MEKVTVIGAGLAGSEAAWQLAEWGSREAGGNASGNRNACPSYGILCGTGVQQFFPCGSSY